MTIRRTLAAALAASAIAAPAASARVPGRHARLDRDRGRQGAAAAGPAWRARTGRRAARRTAQAVNAPGAASGVESQSKSTPVAPGQPTWAVNPKLHSARWPGGRGVQSDDSVRAGPRSGAAASTSRCS